MDRAVFFSSQAGRTIEAPRHVKARFGIGDIVRHRVFDFRGVIFDIDPVFANSEEWYQAIPEDIRPNRDQPFYHLLADPAGGPIDHPQIAQLFEQFDGARYRMRRALTH